MPKPTLQQIFGSGATVTSNQLTLNFSDFASVGWNTATGTDDAEKWLSAIILKAREFSTANTDQVPNINVQEPYPGLITRNDVLKREYSYTVQIYVPDSGSTIPDPDLI